MVKVRFGLARDTSLFGLNVRYSPGDRHKRSVCIRPHFGRSIKTRELPLPAHCPPDLLFECGPLWADTVEKLCLNDGLGADSLSQVIWETVGDDGTETGDAKCAVLRLLT